MDLFVILLISEFRNYLCHKNLGLSLFYLFPSIVPLVLHLIVSVTFAIDLEQQSTFDCWSIAKAIETIPEESGHFFSPTFWISAYWNQCHQINAIVGITSCKLKELHQSCQNKTYSSLFIYFAQKWCDHINPWK